MKTMRQRLRAISLAVLAGAAAASACTSGSGTSATTDAAGQSGAGADSDSGGSSSGKSSSEGGAAAGQGGSATEANAGAGGIPDADDAIVTCTTKFEGAACECRRTVESAADSVPCSADLYGGATCFAYLGATAFCRCFRYGCIEDDESYDCSCNGSDDATAPTSCPGAHAHYCLNARGDCYGHDEPCGEGPNDDESSVEVPSCAYEVVAPLLKPTVLNEDGKFNVADCALEAAGFPDSSEVGKPCVANADCGKDFHCIRTQCAPALRPGQDCLKTEECVTNFECTPIDGRKQCYLPRRLNAACDDEHYCYRGLVCENGTCATAGSSDCNGGCGPCQYFGSEACCYTCKSGTCEQTCSF